MKRYISLVIALIVSMLIAYASVSEAKGFGGRSGGFSSGSRSGGFGSGSRSISSPTSRSSSGSGFSWGGSKTKAAVAGGSAAGSGYAWSSSNSGSSSGSKPSAATIKVQRDNVLTGLKGGGAKGDQAGVLWKSFKAKSEVEPTSTPFGSGRLNRAEIQEAFKPERRASRRSDYYGAYNPRPATHYRETVYVNHSNGYGLWDLMLFNSILDNVGDRNMYYHHQNDPSFQQWRTDANAACAAGDTDVCDKLKDLDKEMAEYKAKGVKVNPTYLTPGIDPDIYESNNIDPKTLTEIKICTGSIGSDYNSYVNDILKNTKLKAVTVPSNGSADNLAKLATGVCDMAFVQDDLVTTNLVKVVTPNQMEAGMFVCRNDSKVATASDLDDETTVYVGSDQTGSQFTLDELKKLSPTIAHIKVNNTLPILQATKAVQDTKDVKSCIFAVSTPEFAAFKDLDSTGKFHGVPVFSKNLNKGQPYKLVTVGVNHYKNLVPEEYRDYGWNPGGIDTIGVSTSLVTSQAWLDRNPTLAGLLNLESRNLKVSISR